MKQFFAWLFGWIGGNKKPPIIVKPPIDKPVEPVKWNWKDKRPIGQIVLASAPQTEEALMIGNRQWKLGGQMVDLKDFRTALISHARYCVDTMIKYNFQGGVTWDIEGQEYFHPISYMGQPQMLATLAPEMDAIADEYFRMYKDAGLKTGVTLRPDTIRWFADKRIWWHFESLDPFTDLDLKIQYCKDRWKCSLFYIDSNIGLAADPEVFRKLSVKHPDCLIMPEHQTAEWYPFTAPYNDIRFRHLLTAEEKGFQVLMADGFTQEQLTASVKQGNILVGRVWFPSDELELIKQAYATD